jgi:rhomboid protease GluP
MDSTETHIPVRSERQAMDWSLVLASQGISATILKSENGQPWLLAVDAQDYPAAQAAIRQYRLENRGWHWRSHLPWSDVIFHWGSGFWCVYLALIYLWDARSGLQTVGVMNSAAVKTGQWWRLFTAISLHGSVGHLATNLSFGFLFLGLAMARYGIGPALLTAYLAGAFGNIAGLLLYAETHRALGASGMVMGALGLISIHALALWFESRKAVGYILGGILTGLMLLTVLGLDPMTDVVAHVGGFLAGCVFGGLLALMPQPWLQKPDINFTLCCLCIGLTAWTWWLALR